MLHFLDEIAPTNNRIFLTNPKETYDLNLTKVTSSIWSFCTTGAIFNTENWHDLASFHYVWQASDSVCTTVLTVTLSQKKKTALRAVF